MFPCRMGSFLRDLANGDGEELAHRGRGYGLNLGYFFGFSPFRYDFCSRRLVPLTWGPFLRWVTTISVSMVIKVTCLVNFLRFAAFDPQVSHFVVLVRMFLLNMILLSTFIHVYTVFNSNHKRLRGLMNLCIISYERFLGSHPNHVPSKLPGCYMFFGLSGVAITVATPFASYIDCNFAFVKEFFGTCATNVGEVQFWLEALAQYFITMDIACTILTYITVISQESTFHFTEMIETLLKRNLKHPLIRRRACNLYFETKLLEKRVNSALGPAVFSILLAHVMIGSIVCLSIFITQYQSNPLIGVLCLLYTGYCLAVVLIIFGQMATVTALSLSFLEALRRTTLFGRSKLQRKLLSTLRPISFWIGSFLPVSQRLLLPILNAIVIYTSTLLLALAIKNSQLRASKHDDMMVEFNLI